MTTNPTSEATMHPFSIHPDTKVGPVDLQVANLDRSEQFYRDVIGFKSLDRVDGRLVLTADGATPLVVLREHAGAQPRPPRSTGLYHFAILVPSRADLARSLARLAEMRWPLSGASDHHVSEALYLDDPDGNGIEIYRDRPRDSWRRASGEIHMTVDPLDLRGLLADEGGDLGSWQGLAPGTTIGHVHLHVADLPAAEVFYHGVLGFDVILNYGDSALFVSAGGYHHHLGLNTWAGVGAPPPPPDAAGLRHFTVLLPGQEALDQVVGRVRAAGVAIDLVEAVDGDGGGLLLRDPSQNGVRLTLPS
jgi:catechol 2,3-dioxygenase